MPRVSVIIPAYNAAEDLPRCIESAIRQTENSIQIIIVNDGSIDNTLDIAELYAKKDSRILIINQRNKGSSGARNSGLSAATGDFVCFLDSDDWIEPEMIEVMASWCEATASEVSVAGMILDYYDKDDRPLQSEVQTPEEQIIDKNTPVPSTVVSKEFIILLGYSTNKIYRRDWLINLGEAFSVGLSLYEDADFNARVLPRATRVAFIPQAFYHYVQRPSPSMIKIRDADFLSVSHRAIRNFDLILEEWGVSPETRNARAADASARALWVALNDASKNPNPKDFLERLLTFPGGKRLIECATTSHSSALRDRWSILIFSRGWHHIGLSTLAIIQPLRRYKVHIFELLMKCSRPFAGLFRI